MSKKLFIVESPNKCAKISKYLGPEYRVMASVGHVRGIPKKGMNIDINNGFLPKFEISADKKRVVDDIKSQAKKSDEIFLATDNDMEGEAIAWHIYDLLDANSKKKCKRVVFNEITKKAIFKGLDNKGDINMNKVDAQKARQTLDRLIGYTMSPILWKKVENNTSAGRVQSIALNIIAQREKEIKNFNPEDFWYIDVSLSNDNGEFVARVVTENKENRYLDEKISKEDATKLKTAKYKVEKVEKKIKNVSPYPPFDTSSMQTACSSYFGWKSKKVNSLAQKLYENGLITYLRTDSFNISEEAVSEVRSLIKDNCKSEYIPKTENKYSKKSSSSQEAHECIRPTDVSDKGNEITNPDEKKLYKFIRDRFIACQMSDAKVGTVTYYIKTNTGHNLISKGQSIVFDGWRSVYKYISSKDVILPEVEKNELLKYEGLDKSKHSTQPPPRYNEGSLIKKLESEGVGRPSTYSSIMESIQNRNYVETIKGKKGAMGATELGLKVNDYLEPNFSDNFFMDIHFTSSLEAEIDKIQMGELSYLEVVQKVYDLMMAAIKKAKADQLVPTSKQTGAKCPCCEKGDIVEKSGKFGKFFACSNYPACKSIFTKEKDDFVLKKNKSKSQQNTGVKCDKCSSGYFVERKNKTNGSLFYGCSAWPKCKNAISEDAFKKIKK